MGKPRKQVGATELAAFIRAYGRKAPKSGEPNDRGYDRALEARIKRLRPEELDALLRDEDGGRLEQEAEPSVATDRRKVGGP